MLKFDSVVGSRMTKAAQKGVALVACGNSTLNFKLPEQGAVSGRQHQGRAGRRG